ncbi:MAG: hypothetical protein DCC57_23260, partial [Chloroflexi bacterium]
MEPDPIPLSLLVLALAAIGFAVAAQTSLSNVSRSAMRKRSEEGESRAKIAEYLLRNPGSVEIATMLLKAAAVLVAGAAVVRLL